MSQPIFTVIIPTCRRPGVLSKTLSYLEQQLCDFEFEVILVNDGPADALPDLGFGTGKRANWKLLQNPHNLGRAATRNRGIQEAIGEYMLMIDDDIWAVPGLLQAHYEKQKEIGGGVVVGAVPPAKEIEDTVWHRYLKNRYDLIKKRLHGSTIDFTLFFTGNVSVPASVIKKFGGFNEKFKEYSFEDTELGYRLFRDGVRFVHAPDAIGFHVLQDSFESLMSKAFQSGKSEMVFKELAPEIFNESVMYSCALKKWKGIEIAKNIAKLTLSTRIVVLFVGLVVKTSSLMGLNSIALNILPYLEIAQRIRGTRVCK